MAHPTFDLDKVLMQFPDGESTFSWTVRRAVEGVQIFGGIGSGKTSGSGQTLALKYLRADFGGVILTAKPGEKELWEGYCREAGRLNDLIIVEPGGKHFFNFLEYESSTKGETKSYTENIVQVLKTVIQASEEKSGGKRDDPFWEEALDMLLFNSIDLCMLAYGSVSIEKLYDLVLSLPKKDQAGTRDGQDAATTFGSYKHAFKAAQQKVDQAAHQFLILTTAEQRRAFADEYVKENAIMEAVPEAKIFKAIDQFFNVQYRGLNEKTRSIVDFLFSGFLFRLLREPVFSLFCSRTSTFSPEDSLDGKIILINLPVKLYHKVGRDCQIMFKYIWQRAMEKRDVDANNRPVFLWADEAQNFLHSYDAEFQATARSSRIATVYLSQNIPNYYANMGGEKSTYHVKSFLGTLATKIFHANSDYDTNKYASELMGEEYLEVKSKNFSIGGNFSRGESLQEQLRKKVRPEEFMTLRSGSASNKSEVECYMVLQGNSFRHKANFTKLIFKQNI